MAILEIKKAKSIILVDEELKEFTFEVEQIIIFDGEVFLVPKNKKYQYLELKLNECQIIK